MEIPKVITRIRASGFCWDYEFYCQLIASNMNRASYCSRPKVGMAPGRLVLNVGRSISLVGRQVKGGNSNTKLKGFLVAISSGQRNSSYLNNYKTISSPFLSLNDFCRRYYFLPSPPPVKILHEVPDGAGVFAITNAETNDRVMEFAQFAAKAHNESSVKDGGEDHARFVRVVRVWRLPDCCERYHITLERVDGKGELNVYYEEVVDTPFQKMTKLDKWELVDQSFSYPFQEARWSEQLKRKETARKGTNSYSDAAGNGREC